MNLEELLPPFSCCFCRQQMTLQSFPTEIVHRIFQFLDYGSLHTFNHFSGSKERALNEVANSVLSQFHVFITNYKTQDFRSELTSSSYIENISKIIDSEATNSIATCSCRGHGNLKRENLPVNKIYFTSSMESIIVPPKILTLYLIYPGGSERKKTSFSSSILQFISLVKAAEDNQDHNQLSQISKINVYIDFDEFLINSSSLTEGMDISSSSITTLYRQLYELESTIFNSKVLQPKLGIFSIVIADSISKLHGNVGVGLPFDKTIREFSNLSHLSLPYHAYSDADASVDGSIFQLPKFLNSLNLCYSSTLTATLLNKNSFPPYLGHLNLRGNDLGELIEKGGVLVLPQTLKYANLSDNGIKSLSNIEFPNSLRSLDLSENYLSDLSIVTTGSQRSYSPFSAGLLNLNLSYNHLLSIEKVHFPTSLLRVSLSANYLTDSLSYTGVPLTQFPDSVEFLDLSMNRFTDLSAIRFPESLMELDISDNRITFIDENGIITNENSRLEMINISGNPLKKLEPFIYHKLECNDRGSKLPKLRALFLNNVDLASIFTNSLRQEEKCKICFPKSLQYLHMLNTGITEVSNLDIEYGSNLKVLNLS